VGGIPQTGKSKAQLRSMWAENHLLILRVSLIISEITGSADLCSSSQRHPRIWTSKPHSPCSCVHPSSRDRTMGYPTRYTHSQHPHILLILPLHPFQPFSHPRYLFRLRLYPSPPRTSGPRSHPYNRRRSG
jgi:hypothetical protein